MDVAGYRKQIVTRKQNTKAQTAGGSSPKTIMLIAGARPNFVKLAPLHAALSALPERFTPVLVHTGQHYDTKMSDVFFTELGIPTPDISLAIGSDTHAKQTAKMMVELEQVFTEHRPDMVVIFGDVNSTLAAALTATKLHIPVAHVEAGLRSFDRSMPEEINRIVADTLSDILLTPSRDANRNLEREGIPREKITMVGNIMIDTLIKQLPKADQSTILTELNLQSRKYALVTMHRPANVDDPAGIEKLLDILEQLTRDHTVVFPVHPRTRHNLVSLGGRAEMMITNGPSNLKITEPLGYLDFLKLQKESAVTLTDSGGVQEETTFLGAPCLTLRPNTERPVTITHGTNHLIGLDTNLAIEHALRYLNGERPTYQPPPMWDGKTAQRIIDVLDAYLFSGDPNRELEDVTMVAREEAVEALITQ